MRDKVLYTGLLRCETHYRSRKDKCMLIRSDPDETGFVWQWLVDLARLFDYEFFSIGDLDYVRLWLCKRLRANEVSSVTTEKADCVELTFIITDKPDKR